MKRPPTIEIRCNVTNASTLSSTVPIQASPTLIPHCLTMYCKIVLCAIWLLAVLESCHLHKSKFMVYVKDGEIYTKLETEQQKDINFVNDMHVNCKPENTFSMPGTRNMSCVFHYRSG